MISCGWAPAPEWSWLFPLLTWRPSRHDSQLLPLLPVLSFYFYFIIKDFKCIILWEGIPHGHTGHVRFLTCVEATPEVSRSSRSHHLLTAHHRFSVKGKDIISSSTSSPAQSSPAISTSNRFYVISGGDGYEDFRHTGFADSVGREDSTNHLLMWQVWSSPSFFFLCILVTLISVLLHFWLKYYILRKINCRYPVVS